MKRLLWNLLLLTGILLTACGALADDYPYYTEIWVSEKPKKTTYNVGEAFDPEGIEISGTVVKDASGKTGINKIGTSGLRWSPKTFTSEGKKTVTLTLSVKGKDGKWVDQKCTTTVNVTDKTNYPYCAKIDVTKEPKKTTYVVGESFDPAGIEVTGTYVKDAKGTTSKSVLATKKMKVSPTSFKTAGKQKVTLSLSVIGKSGAYKTMSTTMTVNVTDKAQKVPKITKHPTGEVVEPGSSASFIARADGYESLTWTFISPHGTEYSVDNARKKIGTVMKVSGESAEKLRLTHIPAAADGWKVYCTFKNAAGSVRSDSALISVTEEEEATNTPVPQQTGQESTGHCAECLLSLIPEEDASEPGEYYLVKMDASGKVLLMKKIDTGDNGPAERVIKGTVNAKTVAVRTAASQSSLVTAYVYQGEEVTVLRRTGKYYEVETKAGVRGYCWADYVTASGVPVTD
ncbi:MAG: bacterial Ig-like domain-containing protein [Clostridia bacterium]|nr:bacterial Ig-like domain-containing protein [Clostridia bacterium]